jgi:uncharacterized membrane-anchored protein
MADGQEGGLVISRGWLAITGTLVGAVMALGSWGVSQTVGRSTMSLQIETLERRLESMDARGEARRVGVEATWRSFEERLANLSDRLARVEVRLDTGAGLDTRRNRSSLEGWQDQQDRQALEPAVLRWSRR